MSEPPAELPGTFERIRRVVLSVPSGQVASYGQVAQAAGCPRGARTVVWVLRAYSATLPWHRIVRKDGSLALSDPRERQLQKSLLEAEGVEFTPDQKVAPSAFWTLNSTL